MKKEELFLIIEADTDDGDTIVSVSPITESELALYLPIMEAIASCPQRHNCPLEYRGEQAIRDGEKSGDMLYGAIEGWLMFKRCIPYHDRLSYGIHTIVSVDIVKGGIIKSIKNKKIKW